VDDELTANFFLAMRKEAFGLDRGDHPDTVAILRERLMRRWPTAEALLARTGGPWFVGGQEPTLIDLAVIPLAVRLPAWKPELEPPVDTCPLTRAWLQSLRERPSAAEVERRGERVT
jgi:glutathione S-transferase